MVRLSQAVSASDTTITLGPDFISRADFPESGVVLIESEQVRYTNTTDRELIGCTRGFSGTTAATHAKDTSLEVIFSDSQGVETLNYKIETVNTYTGTSSHQPIASDLTLSSTAGKDISSGTAHLAAIMGNLFGAVLTKTGTYLAGLIGKYSVTGAKGTHLQAGGVLGVIADGVTEADGAVVAVLDGDSAVTTATAAFAVRKNNSVPGSDFAVGLDLQGTAHDGFTAVAYTTGEIRFSNGTKVTVSGDTITFTNLAGTKSFTITMV